MPNANMNVDLATEASTHTDTENLENSQEDDKREEIKAEINKLEDEIVTLKQALQRKERQLATLREEIGETKWAQMKSGVTVKYQAAASSQLAMKSKQAMTDATVKTSAALKNAGAAAATKFTEFKESPRIQSASASFWAATGSLKAKIVGDQTQEDKAPTAEVAKPEPSPAL